MADKNSQVLTVMQKYDVSLVWKSLLLTVSDGKGTSGLYWFTGNGSCRFNGYQALSAGILGK